MWRLVLLVMMFGTIRAAHAESNAPEAPEKIPTALNLIRHVVPLFEAGRFSAGTDTEEAAVLPYRLFVPSVPDDEKNTKYPLILWLHGYGATESNYENLGQLIHTQLVFRDANRDRYPFFFLVPHNISSSRWFHRTGPSADHAAQPPAPGELVIALLRQLLDRYPIDPHRMTIVGISSGARASWEFACHYPELFAGVAPLAGVVPLGWSAGPQQLNQIVDIPIWAFHSSTDQPEGVRAAVSQLQRLGGRCHLTEITAKVPGPSHDCWTAAFRDYPLLEWLLAQRQRGGSDSELSQWPCPRKFYSLWHSNWPAWPLAVAGLFSCWLLFVYCRRS